MARADFEPIRSLAFGGISGTYAVVGTATANPVRLVCFTNLTEGNVMFTRDNTEDEIVVAAGGFKLFDVQSNINPNKEDRYTLAQGTQFFVKQLTAPVSGAVYIEIMY